MKDITNTDLELAANLLGKEKTDDTYNQLKLIYDKLGHLCSVLEKKGYKAHIIKRPLNQGSKALADYLWAKVYPPEYHSEVYDKLAYIIGVTDNLHFHLMGLKGYQDLAPSKKASNKCWRQIDVQNKNYEQIANEFIQFENINKQLFIETAAALNIKGFQQILNEMSISEKIELLKHKKQIILQGPPGTGKTRLAEQIAKELTKNESTNIIKENLKVGDKIANASGKKDYYTILKITDNYIELQSERSEPWKPTFNKILLKYNELVNGIEPSNKNSKEPYELAVAKHLFKNKKQFKNNEVQYKVIQFHPSYTYEDFVRGITVENNESGNIEYKTKNRVLAEYAALALKNYNDFYKDETTYSSEVLLEEYFILFLDKINEEIENSEGFYRLTKSVGLIDIDEDAFRYRSPAAGWNQRGDRMLFKDIKQAFLDGNMERQDLKKNENLSGLAKQHASYFVRVLNLFQQFLKDENLNIKNKEIEKDPLKNYVLIIDEINRANLSSVLGELIYALEYRGKAVDTIYEMEGSRKITLPPNLLIIGTMNTADRSVGQIDYAIRRRFAFVDVLPKVLSETDLNAGRKEKDPELFFKEDVFLKVKELFTNDKNENSEHLSEEFEAKDVQLGHSYFIYTENNFKYNLDYEIKPILREYVTDGILKDSADKKIIEEINAL